MNITEAEAIVREELGERYVPVNLSGYWMIMRRREDGRLVTLTPTDLPLRRRLHLAISDLRTLRIVPALKVVPETREEKIARDPFYGVNGSDR